MDPDVAAEVTTELQAWRTRVLNSLLVVGVAVLALVVVLIVVEATRQPGRWPAAVAFLLIYLSLVGLAILRRPDPRLRAWSLLLLSYLAALLTFVRGGLGADGRVFLLALPILALMLLGTCAGLAAAVLSLLTFAFFVLIGPRGWTAEWLALLEDPLQLKVWLFDGLIIVLGLLGLVPMQWRFNRALIKLAAEKAQLLKASRASEIRNRIIAELCSDVAFALRVEPDGTLVPEWTTRFPTQPSGTLLEETKRFDEWLALIHPDDRGSISAGIKAVLSRQPWTGEARITTKSGGERWLRLYARPVWDGKESRTVHIYGAAQDITARRQVETAMRIKESAIEESINAIALTDLDGNLTYVNGSFLRFWGYDSSEQVLGRPAPEFWERQEQVREIVDALREKGGWVGELVARRRDGSLFDAQLSASAITDESGTPICLMGSFLDVTAHKEAERKAIRASQMAAVGRMAAGLAHEINNPLQAVRSYLELMMDFDLEADTRERYLHIALEEIERLTKVTRVILGLAHPADDTRSPVCIANLIQQALELVAKRLEKAHIQVTTDLAPDLPPIMVSPDRIGQVFLNLLNNSVEAMHEGGHICVAAHTEGNAIIFTLTNDGPSVPPTHMKRLFDPFFTTKANGTGLGLAISHSIVRQHGGTITARNREGGRGVVFTITLPVSSYLVEQRKEVTT